MGCVLHDSVADDCGLQSRDFIWKISGEEVKVKLWFNINNFWKTLLQVFGKTHKEVVKMLKACGNVIKELGF